MTHKASGRSAREVAVHQVRCPRWRRGPDWVVNTFLRRRETPSMPSSRISRADLVPADVMAGARGGLPELVGPVDLAVRRPTTPSAPASSPRHAPPAPTVQLAALGGVVAARSHLQCSCRWARLRTRQRCSSMNPTSSLIGGRAPPGRNTPTPSAGSRSPACSSRFSCSSALIFAASSVVTTRLHALIDVGLAHPAAHRLDPVTELVRDPLDRPV